MNEGKYQLVKFTNRTVAEADSLFGTRKRYYFTDEVHYFIRSGDKVEKIKRLDRESVLVLLPSTRTFSEWIRTSNINFKKEEDIVRSLITTIQN